MALRSGKPVSNAVFTAVDSDLSEQTIKADSGGSALWTPAAPGRYSVYVRETLKEPGVLGDKKFDEIREFATLALTWPLGEGCRLRSDSGLQRGDCASRRSARFPGLFG